VSHQLHASIPNAFSCAYTSSGSFPPTGSHRTFRYELIRARCWVHQWKWNQGFLYSYIQQSWPGISITSTLKPIHPKNNKIRIL